MGELSGRWFHRLGMCWACAPAAQKIVFGAAKGNVTEFFGLRFWPFSARVQMVFGTSRI